MLPMNRPIVTRLIFTRPIFAAACAAALAFAAAMPALHSARAQQGGEQSQPQQVALTQAQIDGLIASQADMGAAQGSGPSDKSDQLDPKAQAKMEAIAKKHGFSGLDQYGAVTESIGIVMGGIDPETKSYIGPTAVIKKQIAAVQADKRMPPRDRAEALKELKEAMSAGPAPKPPAGNIELVSKNFDKLSQAFQGPGGE